MTSFLRFGMFAALLLVLLTVHSPNLIRQLQFMQESDLNHQVKLADRYQHFRKKWMRFNSHLQRQPETKVFVSKLIKFFILFE